MTIQEYIEAEFRRYFPELTDINVVIEDEENYTVTMFTDLAPNTPWVFTFECGSDDDWYTFVNLNGQDPEDAIDPRQVITIPLMREAVS